MRLLLPLFLALPTPLLADVIEASSAVSAVTIYPQGARVQRDIVLDAAAGRHTLLIPDLPQGIDAASLRIAAPDGVRISSMALAEGRQPATGDQTPPAIAAARAEVERLEEVLRQGEQRVARIRLRADAANAQAQFLRGLGDNTRALDLDPDEIGPTAKAIGDGVLAATEAALAASADADAADRGLEPDRKALEAARQHLAALTTDTPTETLTLELDVAAAGPVTLTAASFESRAGWQPVYDLRLSRAEGTPGLVIDRGVLAWQASGEDWGGVDLTVSTARPSDQGAASHVWPWRMGLLSQPPGYSGTADARGVGAQPPAPAPAEAPAMVAAKAELVGVNVSYHFAGKADLRSSVDALRLALDTVTLQPEVVASAAPLVDTTAYVTALIHNTSPEPILPGDATLWFEGEMAGNARLDLIAAGAKTEVGFGAIDGLQLKRTVTRQSGDKGVLTKTSELRETAQITVENLTGERWPVRLVDRVPYSEQDDLVIRWSAEPSPTTVDRDGDRGVLAWDFDLAAGGTASITLDWSALWPSSEYLVE